jgi:Metallo-peptidase family M12B Reprolysin-like
VRQAIRRCATRWCFLLGSVGAAVALAHAGSPAFAQVNKHAQRAELLLSDLPARTSRDYADLRRLAGGDVRVQVLDATASETWSFPRSRLKRLTQRLQQLGVKHTTLDIDWNRLLKPPGKGLQMTSGQELVLEALKSSDETLVVGVMASLKGAAAEYALTRDAQGKVSANRPGSRVVIPFNDEQRITAVRKSIEKKGEGWTWRGEVEGTGEPVMLMWWKGGKFTGLFSYRSHIYTLRNMGGDIHAIIETDPDKLPPDHGPVASQEGRAADLKNDPLVARGEGAAMRPAVAQDGRATFTEVLSSLLKGSATAKIVPLSAAKRRQLLANKVTIDVMILHTPKVAKKYVDIDTDLIALSIEQANDSFASSGIGNVALRLVHHQEIKYDEGKSQHFEHLYSMVDGNGPFAGVHKLRDRKGADVVVLIVDDTSGCGLSTRVAADAGEAFAVVHHTCAALTYSIAHEIGHIIGARHDKALDPNTSPFPYGHGYVNGNKWRDIMSSRQSCSGCPRIPYWSNPTIKIRGEVAGAVDADNARVILEQAERVAKFR